MCDRCFRRYDGGPGWGANTLDGVIVEVVCPSCQTTNERHMAFAAMLLDAVMFPPGTQN